MTITPRTCSECPKPIVRGPFEAKGAFEKRKTCGGYDCKRKRYSRIQRATEQARRDRHAHLNQTNR